MSVKFVEPSFARPPSVSIHDDRDVTRYDTSRHPGVNEWRGILRPAQAAMKAAEQGAIDVAGADSDTKTATATPVLSAGQEIGGAVVGAPVMLAVGGPDLLMLDAENRVWRWRPAPPPCRPPSLVRWPSRPTTWPRASRTWPMWSS